MNTLFLDQQAQKQRQTILYGKDEVQKQQHKTFMAKLSRYSPGVLKQIRIGDLEEKSV